MNEERKAVITVTESGNVDIDFFPTVPTENEPYALLAMSGFLAMTRTRSERFEGEGGTLQTGTAERP